MKKHPILHSPWLFIPILFLAVGAGGGIIGNLTTVMVKDFGYSNALIGAAALLSLPSSLHFLWAPWVDAMGSKRDLCRHFTAAMGLIILITGGLTFTGHLSTLVAFMAIALFSLAFSCLEVASDGYYIRIFNKEKQAEFVGIKTVAIRGIILSIAIFIRMAGSGIEQGGGLGALRDAGWSCTARTGCVLLEGSPSRLNAAPKRSHCNPPTHRFSSHMQKASSN